MFRNCIFCTRDLATNELVEHFPVGRRLAFDGAKGRLWVVCRRCERWNLTPIEERWEAIEDCERLFQGTRLRVSSDNIGMAKLGEGLELVRIGKPLRPEFAAWRYGDQFGRRRKKAIMWGAVGVVAVGAVAVGAVAAGAGAAIAPQLPNILLNSRTLAKVKSPDGRVLKIRNPHLRGARLTSGGSPQDWSLELKHSRGKARFFGEDARKVAGQLLPAFNHAGASRSAVQSAVRAIENVGHPEVYLEKITETVARGRETGTHWLWKDRAGHLYNLPRPTKLALEMALHEEQERVVMEGELALLEEAWREAEEVAGIADDLLVPASSLDFIRKHREGTDD